MKAALFKAIGRPLEIEDIREPTPAPDEVVVEVGRCGICGSDLHMTEDPVFGVAAGTVLGHEFAGEVVASGSGIQYLKTGDLVTASPLRGCGHCPSCLAGRPAWCAKMVLDGGGYAQYTTVTERQCVKLPAFITLEDGALVEPLSVALHGITRSGLTPGARVLVIGAGPIGLATAFWARRLGAAHVTVTDLIDSQKARALEMGATHFFTTQEGIVDIVNGAMGGPPDIVYECVGKPGLITQCIEHVRVMGKIVILGLCTAPDTFIPFTAVSKEVCIQTSAFFEFPEFCTSIDMLESGQAVAHALITDTVSLSNMPETFEALRKRTSQCKVMVNPQG
jgi:(R,R)-butanediol dehydrogenase/meso-butanediol dehydrogenase/diacetyl reductase